MSDLVKKLREYGHSLRAGMGFKHMPELFNSAADEIERLEKALQPFAEYANTRTSVPDDYVITNGSAFAKRQLTFGDCKEARKALGESK